MRTKLKKKTAIAILLAIGLSALYEILLYLTNLFYQPLFPLIIIVYLVGISILLWLGAFGRNVNMEEIIIAIALLATVIASLIAIGTNWNMFYRIL